MARGQTKAHANADALLCLPLKGIHSKETKTDIFSARQIEALPVIAIQLKCATSYDPMALLYTKQGRSDKVDEPLKPY